MMYHKWDWLLGTGWDRVWKCRRCQAKLNIGRDKPKRTHRVYHPAVGYVTCEEFAVVSVQES